MVEHSVVDILNILKEVDTNKYNQLKMLIDKDIPLSGFQANMIFLGRIYGKTYMSYIKASLSVIEMLKEKDKVRVGADGSDVCGFNLDPDCNTYRRQESWIAGFTAFIEEYFPELKINQYERTSREITIYKGV
jgi:hypothetical protein